MTLIMGREGWFGPQNQAWFNALFGGKHLCDISEQAVLEIILENPARLGFLRFQTDRICLAAVRADGLVLRHVKKQTPEICMAAVRQNTQAFLEARQHTEELCLAACSQNGYFLGQSRVRTPAVCLAAARNSGRLLYGPEYQTPEICLAAVTMAGISLQDVIEQTPEICTAAVRQNPEAIYYVKEQTPELCRLAIAGDPLTIADVCEQTPELCLQAVTADGFALREIPEWRRSYEVCLAAVRSEGRVIADTRKPDIPMVLAAIRNDYVALAAFLRSKRQSRKLAAANAYLLQFAAAVQVKRPACGWQSKLSEHCPDFAVYVELCDLCVPGPASLSPGAGRRRLL